MQRVTRSAIIDAPIERVVYETGFEGLRRYLSQPREGAARREPAAAAGGAMPAQAVVLKGFGGRDQLVYENVVVAAPGPGEVRLRQSAVGVNFIDVYIRRGDFPMVTPPAAIGMEAAGAVPPCRAPLGPPPPPPDGG